MSAPDGDATPAPAPTPAPLTFSASWAWVERVNYFVFAILAANYLRSPAKAHLFGRDAFGWLAFVAALVCAFGTRRACRDDLANHVPAGAERRPDHHGSTAWVWYMNGVLALYLVFFSLPLGVTIFLVPFVFLAQVVFFGGGFVLSLYGLMRDERKLRAGVGLVFPPVALVMSGLALSPILAPMQDRDHIRTCYSNQKTIAGAVEMYELDKKTKVSVLNEQMIKAMCSGGYLQAYPEDPGAAEGTRAYRLVPDGNGVTCDQHGSIQ